MYFNCPTQSLEPWPQSQTQSESPETEGRLENSPPSESQSPEAARLSCDNCRKRKVKCNRRMPNCSLCQKLDHKCVYSSARKRPVRRTRYSELEERLKNMEKALGEGHPGDSHHPSHQAQSMISPPRMVDPSFAWSIPEGGLIEPLDIKWSTPNPAEDNPADFISGSLPIFSGRGIRWIDQLLGDSTFSIRAQGLRRPDGGVGQNIGLLTPPTNLLPTFQLAELSVQGFFSTINSEVPIFQEDIIASNLNLHQSGSGSKTLQAGYIAAINIMIAYNKFRCYPITYEIDTDSYLGNALALLPRLIIEGPSPLNVGAILCIALYFLVASECKTAASILGSAVPMMVNAGYNSEKDASDLEGLFKNRLFWSAYIISSDISLYLGKAPVVCCSILSSLPESNPADLRADVVLQDGSRMNFIYERVAFARIQGKAWSMLHSPSALKRPHHQIYAHVIELDHELDVWKSRIPDLTGNELYDGRECRLVYITLLHMRYHQLVIYIHSTLFTRSSGRDPLVRKMKASPSIARCVQSARASVTLLDHFNKEHPFMGLLSPNISWCGDILCIHALQNKDTAGEDIARLEKIAKMLENFADRYNIHTQSQVANMLYFIAAYGARMAKTVIDQPYTSYVPVPPAAAPQNALKTMNLQAMHPPGDFPIDFGDLDVPQYQDDGRDFTDPALWKETASFEADYAQRGRTFFIPIT